MTEEDCKAAEIPIKCLKSFFRANGKAVTMGDTDGFCKVIVAAEPKEGCESPYEPGRILGCHLYGPHASDIVQEACALISRKATLKEFEDIIHTHPTLTEVLQSAVHN
jgi:dihydrolipoamide dehydrogenase